MKTLKSNGALRSQARAIDAAVIVLIITILLWATGRAIAQPGITGNATCTVDQWTGNTICKTTDGKSYSYQSQGNGTGAPSTYRQGGPDVKYCADGGRGNGGTACKCNERFEEINRRLDALDKGNPGQATTSFVEQRLQALGKVVDERLAAEKLHAEQLAAGALNAAKDNATTAIATTINNVKIDLADRVDQLVPKIATTVKTEVDARLQNLPVGPTVQTVVGFGLKHLLLAAGLGGVGVVPAWLLAKLLGFGFTKFMGMIRRGSGGPRDGGFQGAAN